MGVDLYKLGMALFQTTNRRISNLISLKHIEVVCFMCAVL